MKPSLILRLTCVQGAPSLTAKIAWILQSAYYVMKLTIIFWIQQLVNVITAQLLDARIVTLQQLAKLAIIIKAIYYYLTIPVSFVIAVLIILLILLCRLVIFAIFLTVLTVPP